MYHVSVRDVWDSAMREMADAVGQINMILRGEDREMSKLCREDNMAMTPYSAQAGGRLSKR